MAATAVLTAAGVLMVAGPTGIASAAVAISGGGSGFAGLEISQWTADVATRPYNLTVNYSNQNSTTGRNYFSNDTWDYGVSDIPYTPEEVPSFVDRELIPGRCGGRPAASCFKYVTVSAGGLSFMYNLRDPSSGQPVNSLRLSQSEVCQIFTGQINNWNDPQLVRTNPQLPWLASYNQQIAVVARVDGAGESYVLSQFCEAVAPSVWQPFEGFVMKQYLANNESGQGNLQPAELQDNQPISYWPSYIESGGPNTGGKNISLVNTADGVANFVTQPGAVNSITYDAAGYAVVRGNWPMASVQNESGNYVQPNATSVAVALSYATPRGDGTFRLAFNGPDSRAYFPSTYSYVFAQTGGANAAKAQTLADFLCYSVGKGQSEAAALKYAPLSQEVTAISVAAISQIPGAPSAQACTAGAAPPPVVVALGGPGGSAGGATSGSTAGSASGGAGGAGGTGGSGAASSTGTGAATGAAQAAAARAASVAAVEASKARSAKAAAAAAAAAASNASLEAAGSAGTNGQGSGSAAQLASASGNGPTNWSAFSALFYGAAICGVGMLAVGWRRRRSA